MSTAQKLMTAEEFAARPAPRDDSREELVEGRVVVAPPPGAEHGDVALTIGSALRAIARLHSLGQVLAESGYVLRRRPDSVRGPDVSFVATERLEEGKAPTSYVQGAPDLAVEIVSPGDRAADVNRRVSEYLDAGAKRV